MKSNFSNFSEKEMSKVGLLDLGKYQNEQSHEVSWVRVQNCIHGAQILGSMGHNGPCLCGIGLRSSNKAKEPWKCQEPYYPNLSWFELQTTYNKYSVYRQ